MIAVGAENLHLSAELVMSVHRIHSSIAIPEQVVIRECKRTVKVLTKKCLGARSLTNVVMQCHSTHKWLSHVSHRSVTNPSCRTAPCNDSHLCDHAYLHFLRNYSPDATCYCLRPASRKGKCYMFNVRTPNIPTHTTSCRAARVCLARI